MKWHRVALQNNFQGKFRNWCKAVKYLSITLKPSSFNSRRVTVWTVHRFCQLSVSEMTVGLSYILEPLNWLLSHYRTECSCILACRITQDAVGEFQEVLHCLIFFKDIWDELQCNHNHPSTRVVGFVCFVFVILERAAVLHFLPTVFWVLCRCFLLFRVCLKILLFLCSLTIVWMIKHNRLTAFMLWVNVPNHKAPMRRRVFLQVRNHSLWTIKWAKRVWKLPCWAVQYGQSKYKDWVEECEWMSIGETEYSTDWFQSLAYFS